jgi:hypothetical protein
MSGGKLTPLQLRILRVLARLDPPWVLTGGAALAGVYLQHRMTRDLDLVWQGRSQLGDLPAETQALLRSDGLQGEALERAPSFHRLRVSDGTDTCMVDLVAQDAALLEPTAEVTVGGAAIRVESEHELLVDKLCALLGRCELRDLQDVKALLDAGANLERALGDAPRKDRGFSTLTLAWVLKEFQPHVLASTLGWSDTDTEAIEQFHRSLIDRLLAASAPS